MKTWEDVVGQRIPGWGSMSERNRRAVMAKGSVAGYRVNYTTGLVTRKA